MDNEFGVFDFSYGFVCSSNISVKHSEIDGANIVIGHMNMGWLWCQFVSTVRFFSIYVSIICPIARCGDYT